MYKRQRLASDKPKPQPRFLVVKPGRNTFFKSFFLIPFPVAETSIIALSLSLIHIAFGKDLILMGRSFSRPERMRMVLKQYIKEMSQLGIDSIVIVLLISDVYKRQALNDAYLQD